MMQMLKYDPPSNTHCCSSRGGFAAVASVLVIGVVIVVIGTSVSLLSVNGLQSSFSRKQGAQARLLAESCTEAALLAINENDALPSTITTPEGDCTLVLDSHVGDEWEFTVESSFEAYSKTQQVKVLRDTEVSVTEWIEE